MMESFTYRKWFNIEPIKTSNGIMEMNNDAVYNVEMMSTYTNGDNVYKIRGYFNGQTDDFWEGNDSIIVSQRVYDLIEAYSTMSDFIQIK